MANYTQTTAFGPKDALVTGNTLKRIRGTEVDTELSAIAAAIATKTDQIIDVIAGSGLTGGGTLSASRTFNVGAGTGITVNANDVALDAANSRNADHSAISVLAGTGLTGGGTIAASRTLNLAQATRTALGGAELATEAEIDIGVDDTRVITPLGLAGSALQATVNGISPGAEVNPALMSQAEAEGLTDTNERVISAQRLSQHATAHARQYTETKTSPTLRNTLTRTADPDLSVAGIPAGIYEVLIMVGYTAAGTGDLNYSVTSNTSVLNLDDLFARWPDISSSPNLFNDRIVIGNNQTINTDTSVRGLEIRGVIQLTATTTLSFEWASSVSGQIVTVAQGSALVIRPLG